MVPGYSGGLTGDCKKLGGDEYKTEKWNVKCATEDKVIEKNGKYITSPDVVYSRLVEVILKNLRCAFKSGGVETRSQIEGL